MNLILWVALCLLLLGFRAPATTQYVDLNSPNRTTQYAGWSTAAADIQNALDAASDGDLN